MTDLSDHIEVTDLGAMVILRPVSDSARDWFLKHVGPPNNGPGYLCEPRMVGPIIEGAARALLIWQ